MRTFIIIFQWIIAYKLVQKPKIEALNEPKAMAAFGPEQSQNVRSGWINGPALGFILFNLFQYEVYNIF